MKYLILDTYDDLRHWFMTRFSRRYREGAARLFDDLGL